MLILLAFVSGSRRVSVHVRAIHRPSGPMNIYSEGEFFGFGRRGISLSPSAIAGLGFWRSRAVFGMLMIFVSHLSSLIFIRHSSVLVSISHHYLQFVFSISVGGLGLHKLTIFIKYFALPDYSFDFSSLFLYRSRMRQLNLFKLENSKSFGGSNLIGRRKSRRPISTKHGMHLVMHSQHVLKNGSFVRHRKLVEGTIGRAAHKFGVKVYRLAVARDHIHMVIKVGCRASYTFFVQFVSGFLALKLKIEKGAKFWSYRPFTRVVAWGKDFKQTCKYVVMNELEAMRWIPYQPRGKGCSKKRLPLQKTIFRI